MTSWVRLIDCPPGAFIFNGVMGFRSEYGDDAYVMASGEYFWGGAATKTERAELLVLPLDLDSYVRAINTPEIHDFASGVVTEAQHQRVRWGSEHDAGKEPLDWFWLIGYLAQEVVTALDAKDVDKALHHTISTAAALANWHAAITGQSTAMRPGILTPEEAAGL